ncbi:hypothetical protein AAJ76_280006733 [Vairimorpha ceranae]|uniref:Uncharacterized protein n=1 Tax=Vairimorpha ceranae TaxID=40302 RepID=A0A0F9WCH8_9MICR|nr:hypothetical protein AAJ76_280006733 [Vairimorpha ceranae]KKO75196.1 hypothetical protein AAJ76_280006733 [Vairimorpha ceranae]
MAYLLERDNSPRCTLEGSKKEQFTQKHFTDLIHDSHSRNNDYYIGRVQTSLTDKNEFYCYDARQLCKYLFEMVISTEGRKIRIKNFKDPISQENIDEIHFFRLKYDSDEPLRAEYVGNHKNFLESNSLRSKIFYSEDALDALSVNFQFNSVKKTNLIEKKKLYSFLILLFLGIIVFSSVVLLIEKKKSSRKFNDQIKFKSK